MFMLAVILRGSIHLILKRAKLICVVAKNNHVIVILLLLSRLLLTVNRLSGTKKVFLCMLNSLILSSSHCRLSRRSLSFLLSLLLVVCFLLSLSFLCFAENFSLYSSVSPSDTIVKNLIGIYQNSPDYDPYNEFEVARVGQYDYRIFYGNDLDSGVYSYFQYIGIPSAYGAVSWSYAAGTGSHLYLDKGSNMTVGNVVNTIKSSEAESFKFQYVALGLAFFAFIIFLYKVFRFKISARSSRGWRV